MGKYTEAEKLDIQVLDARNIILGAEHSDTINAMGNLAKTYQYLGKYTEAEKLDIKVLDARNKILEVEHPDTIKAMESLAATYRNLENTLRQRNWISKFWMQGTESLEWNTQTPSMLWKI